MKFLKQYFSLLIAVLIAVAVGVWLLSGQSEVTDQTTSISDGTTKNNELAVDLTPIPTVRTLKSTAASYQRNLKLAGQTAANRQLTLKSETLGRVEEVSASLGRLFDKSELVVRLRMGTRQALLAEAQALITQTELEQKAAERLAKKGFQSDIQEAKASASLAQARADLEEIELDISRTAIKAPFAGRITEQFVEVGDYVKDGDALVTLLDLDPLVIELEVSENDIHYLTQDNLVTVTLNSGIEYNGILKYISPKSTAETRTFTVEIEIDNPNQTLSSGLTARVEIPLPKIKAHKISPAWLTLSDAGEVGIKTVSADSVVQFYPIGILSDLESATWITGLPDETEIIVVGHEFVQHGTQVQVNNGN